MYVSAERTGAQIYIDDQLVRETRIFRRAFYAQGLEATTHKVHVEKEGHHTWVKELPVYPHLVTEAQAFNLPLVPQVRVITPWQTASGVSVLTATSTVLFTASTTNQYLFEPRASTSTLSVSSEFQSVIQYFQTPTSTPITTLVPHTTSGTTEEDTSITTREWRGVRLFESDGEIYVNYTGPRNQMPYYYCAEPFAPYQPATSTLDAVSTTNVLGTVANANDDLLEDNLLLQVKTLDPDSECEPLIKMDRGGESVKYFDFFPNSTDLIILAQESGVYVVEADDRAWQNRQPLLIGTDLEVRVVSGSVYVYDGRVIYQVVINQNWF